MPHGHIDVCAAPFMVTWIRRKNQAWHLRFAYYYAMKFPRLLFITVLFGLSGCASLFNSASEKMADNLSQALLDQNDLEIVHSGMPAYLIMLDSLITGDEENVSMLLAAARLNAAYSTAFVEDEQRRKSLTQKSYDYAQRALCLNLPTICHHLDDRMDILQATLDDLTLEQQPLLYAFASSWAGWIQAHSDDWNALAQIPKLTAMFKHSAALQAAYDHAGAFTYLAVLASQIPPALGGRPEQARAYFEKAEQLSQGKNLMNDVLFAEHYARLVFDQELHDTLLKEVLAANPQVPGLTLINTLAQQRAAVLLQQSDEYF